MHFVMRTVCFAIYIFCFVTSHPDGDKIAFSEFVKV